MDRRQIALKLVLEHLGIAPTMSTFDDRLILQKSIYLAQQLGVPLGYQFAWYLRGPYSRELTADVFATLDGGTTEGWDIGTRAKSGLERLRPFLESVMRQANPVRELEKLASVLFAIKTRQASEKNTGKLTAKLKGAGKDFDQGEVDAAVQTLRDHGFLAEAEDRGR